MRPERYSRKKRFFAGLEWWKEIWMPAYEYLCEECSCQFEKRQKMSDAAVEECPECGGHVRRLISGGAGAITKGANLQKMETPCGSGGCCGGGMCGLSSN
jgi:putative FmdB family regulatory protein